MSNLSSGLRKIIANASFLVSERVINLVISFAVSVYVVRYLGPEQFGLLEYVNSIIAIILPFTRLGIPHLVIRDFVAEDKENQRKIFGTSFTILIWVAIFVFMIVNIIYWQFTDNNGPLRMLIIITSIRIILQAFEIFDYWFQSQVLSKYASASRTMSQLFISGSKLLFVYLTFSVEYFALSVIIGGVIQVLFYIFFYNRTDAPNLRDWKLDKEYAVRTLKNSWPLMISGLSMAIYMKIDQVMLREMVDEYAVGQYAIAVRISELWFFVPMAIINSVFPSIIKARKRDLTLYDTRMKELYSLMVVLGLCVAVFFQFFGIQLITLIYGDQFIEAGKVLTLHIWAGIFIAIGIARSKWIVNENLQKYGMIFNLTGALVNIILNVWLIKVSGILGAAIATIISQAISTWLLAILFAETRKAFYQQTLAITMLPLLNKFKNR